MKAKGFRLITPGELTWRPSNPMRLPNTDYLERSGGEILGACLWRLPPRSANTLHQHVLAEEALLPCSRSVLDALLLPDKPGA